MGWMMKQCTPKHRSEWEQLHDSNPGHIPTAQTSHTPEHSSTTCCVWMMKTFPLYAWLLGLLSQQSSKRRAQLLFMLIIKIIIRANFFLHLPLYKPTKARDAFSFTGTKKGRSRSKAPNWRLPYLSDRWIVHCSFTDSHASQCIPCGVLCPRLQAVSSLFNYSWNQLLFRDPWSKMTVTWALHTQKCLKHTCI